MVDRHPRSAGLLPATPSVREPENSKERRVSMDPHADRTEGLTPAELEAEVAEALPERALMSTMSLSALDPAGDAVDAVTDSVVTTTAAAAGDPAAGPDPAAETAPAEPVDDAVAPAAETTGDG